MTEILLLLLSGSVAGDERSCFFDVVLFNQCRCFVAREQPHGCFDVFAVGGIRDISLQLGLFHRKTFSRTRRIENGIITAAFAIGSPFAAAVIVAVIIVVLRITSFVAV